MYVYLYCFTLQPCLLKETYISSKSLLSWDFIFAEKAPSIVRTIHTSFPCQGKIANISEIYLDMDIASGCVDVDINDFLKWKSEMDQVKKQWSAKHGGGHLLSQL